jgi:molybdenum cofactor biosynthesis enzyme MoaA
MRSSRGMSGNDLKAGVRSAKRAGLDLRKVSTVLMPSFNEDVTILVVKSQS